MDGHKANTIEMMELLITDEKLRLDMAKKAMEKAKSFSIDSISGKWYALFNEV